MVIEIVTASAVVLALLGELLHFRRCRRVARLAFGPTARPAPWARSVPLARSLAAGALAWGLITLIFVDPKVHVEDSVADEEFRHLLLVLDVSPSMTLKDAGKTREQTRQRRSRDVLDSLFSRVSVGRYKVSVVAVYNGAKPVVIDTEDSEVVRNILDDLPMHFAFKPGKTKLLEGIKVAADIAKPWEAKSTIMVLVSDGDTVPATGMPDLPPSIQSVLVVGVGDPLAGSFIDGRQSRQDVSTLRQIAVRLGGVFHNGNEKHIGSETIRAISEGARKSKLEQLTRREYALICVAVGAGLLALLPFLLHWFGTAWRPGVRSAAGPIASDSGKTASQGRSGLSRPSAATR